MTSERAESPFRYSIFTAVWVSTLVSNFGVLIQAVGASWMMTSLTDSRQMVAFVQTAASLPVMFLALPAGAIADTYDKRMTMLIAQVFRLLASVILAACAFSGILSPWLLLGFTFLIGCGAAVNSPAWQASVGDMVPREVLPSAIAFNSMGFNIARSAGPAIGGIIVAVAGAVAAFLVNAFSYIGLIVVLLRWRPASAPRLLPREGIMDAMTAGVRYVAMSPSIRIVLLRATLFGMGASSVQALLPLVARDLVSGGPFTFGMLLGAFGIGAVVGAYASRDLRRRMKTETVVRLGSGLIAAGSAAAAFSHSLLLSLPFMALGGAGWVLTLSTFNVSVQTASPRWVVARALALYQMATFGGMAAGSWAIGLAAQQWGVSVGLLGAAACLAVSAVFGIFLPLAQFGGVDLNPVGTWEAPDLATPIQPRSGPIVIAIEHRIAEGDIVPFLSAMHERRRIRIRDGARHWTLMRDLSNAQLWIERYEVPTWLDYLRHNERRTMADTVNSEALRDLRIGGGDAVVHRFIERHPSAPSSAGADESRPVIDSTTETSASG